MRGQLWRQFTLDCPDIITGRARECKDTADAGQIRAGPFHGRNRIVKSKDGILGGDFVDLGAVRCHGGVKRAEMRDSTASKGGAS